MSYYEGPDQSYPVQLSVVDRLIFDGKRMRKPIVRRTVDYGSPSMKYAFDRVFQRDERDIYAIQPRYEQLKNILPPFAYSNPSTSICTKFIHTSINKVRCPVNCVTWTPEGRRLITGSSSGEFTLWNGLTFNFETILQAHDSAIRAMEWSHNETWLVTGDHGGVIKYWQSNMNNMKAFTAHKEAVRDISFCPTDTKFASCSDDVTLKIWDFASCEEETVLTGHGWDVKSVAWHPQKSLIVSGSKDNLIKFWDARSGKTIYTLHSHKNTVSQVEWNKNGNWLLSGSRDQLLKVFELRTFGELQTFRGHRKEVNSCAWHPFHESLFVSGGLDGSIMYWLVGNDEMQGEILGAHEGSVWSLDWHPVGHILCSGSNDHTTKFWSRNYPGDMMRDRYNNTRYVFDKHGGDFEMEQEMDDGYSSVPGLGTGVPNPSGFNVGNFGSNFGGNNNNNPPPPKKEKPPPSKISMENNNITRPPSNNNNSNSNSNNISINNNINNNMQSNMNGPSSMGGNMGGNVGGNMGPINPNLSNINNMNGPSSMGGNNMANMGGNMGPMNPNLPNMGNMQGGNMAPNMMGRGMPMPNFGGPPFFGGPPNGPGGFMPFNGGPPFFGRGGPMGNMNPNMGNMGNNMVPMNPNMPPNMGNMQGNMNGLPNMGNNMGPMNPNIPPNFGGPPQNFPPFHRPY